ncbi:chromosomal replication initiator DnaA [Clostridium botulinum]|uniref:Chromosomal replication initiator DnaA n=1 Tax=Clostridium botulinum TaxID=1491 RepID=A0AAU8Z347_CLOBO|nr:chromosomal replication initiator DnaA [Clostridium botulinum]NFL97236.1 DnaD domain protein [Clostridium botulinum]NFP54155.1 DnaD domain protein [Clostridium botulinum]NFT11370.1 DnaD domain protein [Clostridium botulinum]NFT62529.1 DnaD domain protein [Clostridium botulinum]
MAKYRQLHTQFWSDGFVLDLTPEEKYFYLYLMSNTKTSQCGVYELPLRVIEMETGYNRETVIKLIKRFIDYKKIKYDEETKEIMIFNWVKYNVPNNINSIKCINKELKNIKNKEFIKILYLKYCELQLDIEKLFDGIFILTNEKRTLEGVNEDIGSKEGISNKEEVRNEEINTNLEDVVTFFKKNICTPKDLEYRKIKEWANRIDCDVIIMAIEEAVKYNAKNIQYIENVLYSWDERALKTKKDVQNYKKQWSTNKKNNGSNTDSWSLIDQRQYDFKELERKLLGWENENVD